MSGLTSFNPKLLIGFAVGIAFLVAVVPSAITSLFAVNTTGWNTSVVALWALVPLVIVAAVIYFLYDTE